MKFYITGSLFFSSFNFVILRVLGAFVVQISSCSWSLCGSDVIFICNIWDYDFIIGDEKELV